MAKSKKEDDKIDEIAEAEAVEAEPTPEKEALPQPEKADAGAPAVQTPSPISDPSQMEKSKQ
jgi:hypothetical protein